MSKHKRRDHLVLLGPQDLPMRWIFQPVMCRTFPTSSHSYWWHMHLPPPSTPHLLAGYLGCLPATHVLPLPALSSLLQTQQHLSESLSPWQERSEYQGPYLFMCSFIPSQGWGSGRDEGRTERTFRTVKFSAWYYNDGYMSLYSCPNP